MKKCKHKRVIFTVLPLKRECRDCEYYQVYRNGYWITELKPVDGRILH